MCCYIYSPDSIIKLDYVSEVIKLRSNGSANIVIDFLIHNISSNEIKSIFILYPNNFYNLFKNNQTNQIDLQPFNFLDQTQTLCVKDNPLNLIYNTPGIDFKPERHGSNHYKITLKEPNHNNPRIGYDNIYTGYVKGKVDFQVYSDLSVKQYLILKDKRINFTFFKINFSIPINNSNDDKRWLRLEFNPKNVIIYPEYTKLSKILFYFCDKIIYESEIVSPNDVLHRLKEKLDCFESNPEEDLFDELSDLKNLLITEGTEKSFTTFNCWKLNIFVDDMNNIEANIYGDILICGSIPNYVEFKTKKNQIILKKLLSYISKPQKLLDINSFYDIKNNSNLHELKTSFRLCLKAEVYSSKTKIFIFIMAVMGFIMSLVGVISYLID